MAVYQEGTNPYISETPHAPGGELRERSPPPAPRARSRSRSPARRRSPPGGRRAPVNPTPSNVLGVFGLSIRTKERDLEDEFARYGNVEKVNIVYDQRTDRSRGFGFIKMSSVEEATKCIQELNGIDLNGRRIRVDYSVTDRAHQPTPGEYMGARRSYRGESNFGRDRDRDRDSYRDRGRDFRERDRDRDRERDYPREDYRRSTHHDERDRDRDYDRDRGRDRDRDRERRDHFGRDSRDEWREKERRRYTPSPPPPRRRSRSPPPPRGHSPNGYTSNATLEPAPGRW